MLETWINQTFAQYLQGYSLLAIVLVLLAGIITSFGPCNLSMIPVLMAYVGGSSTNKKRGFLLSLFFTLGTSTTFALLGVIVSLVGGFFGTSKQILFYVAAIVSITVGLKMVGIVQFSLPSFGSDRLRPPKHKGLGASFFMGLAMGLAGSQCGTPVLFAILTLVMAKGQILFGALLLFVYGLGRGVPVVLAGTFTGFVKNHPGLARRAVLFDRLAGSVLILIGLYFIWTA